MDAEGPENTVTCIAPVNIAVIKYWGKKNDAYNIPMNSSVSVTLDVADLCAKTTISVAKRFQEDEMWLNGRLEDGKANKRLQRVLHKAREASHKGGDRSPCYCHIASWNNFPTAAGLASSAAGYACLAKCLSIAYHYPCDQSVLARLGSGSACRSMYGGFVRWDKGELPDGSDSIAVQIADEHHWPDLRILILVVSDQQKSIGSTEAMKRSVETSELLKYRAQQVVPERVKQMESAILNRDFDIFAELTMKDSNQLHAICQDTYPPIVPPYMNATSHRIVQLVTALNSASMKAAYTFDAGPNAVIFTLSKYFREVVGTILKYFPSSRTEEQSRSYINLHEDVTQACVEKAVELIHMEYSYNALLYIISTKPGPGVQEVGSEESLLDEHGLPLSTLPSSGASSPSP